MKQANPTQDTGASSITDRIAATLIQEQEGESSSSVAAGDTTEAVPVEEVQEIDSGDVETQETDPEAAEVDDATEDVEEDQIGAQLSTEDFAQLLQLDSDKIDVDDDGNVVVRTKIDGVEKATTFKEIVSDYQKVQHADNQLRQVAEQRKALQEAERKSAEERAQKLANLDAMIDFHKNQVLGKYQQYTPERLEGLRQHDPAEYSAVIADYQRDVNSINQAMAQAQAQKDIVSQEQEQEYRQQMAAEMEKLVSFVPEWSDAEVAKKEKQDVLAWASSELNKWGEDAQQLANIDKGFIVDMMRKAMLYDRLQGSKPEVQNKVRKAPKIVKSGAKPNQKTSEQKKIQVLKKNIKKKAGRGGSVAEFLIATGRV